MSSKMYRCIKCSLRAPKMRKKWYSTRSSLHQKSASFTDYLGNYVPLYSCNTSRDRHRKKYLKYPRMFSCNFPHSKYKNKNHKSNCLNYNYLMTQKKTLVLLCLISIPVKQQKHHIVKEMPLTDKIASLKSHGSKCHSKEHSDRKHHSQKSLPKIIVAKTVMRKTSWNKMCIKMCF